MADGGEMTGKVVMVTGAFGALGRAVVQCAMAQGFQVAAVGRTADADLLAGTDVLAIGGIDLTEAAQAGAAVEQVLARYGRLDALINTVGGFVWQTTADGDPAAWARMHRLNVVTVLNACRAALPPLIRSGAGAIVNVGAYAALQAGAGMGCYAASKAGVHRLTEALAEEVKADGVTVNAVAPTILDTPANRAEMGDADAGKWVRPAELAEIMLFLTGARAVTGAIIPVRGRV